MRLVPFMWGAGEGHREVTAMGWVQSLSHSPRPLQTLWPVAPSSPLTWVRQEAEVRGVPQGSDRLPLRCDGSPANLRELEEAPGRLPCCLHSKGRAKDPR